MNLRTVTTILLIEDNPGDANLIKEMIDDTGMASLYNLIHVKRAKDAVKYLTPKHAIDIILSDVKLPDTQDSETIQFIKEHADTIPVILVTGSVDEIMALSAIQTGIQDYLPKGEFDSNMLIRSIRYAIERKKAEVKEEQYKMLFNSIDEGFCIIEMIYDNNNKPVDYRFLTTNPVFEEQTGLKNAVGKTARELVPNLEDKWPQIYGKVAKTGTPHRFTNGSDAMGRWFDVYASKFGGTNSDSVSVTFKDVTLQRRTEYELKKSEGRFRSMTDSVPVMIWITNKEGKCIYLNKQWYSYTGQNEKNGLGFGWLKAVHKEDSRKAGLIFLEANKEHGPFAYEYRLKKHDGSYRWHLDSGLPKFDIDGNFEGYIGSVIDIHDRKVAEDELFKNKQRQDIMLQATELGIWYCDLPFDELIWDEKVKEHFWLKPQDTVTIDTFYSIIHPDDRERTRKAIQESIIKHMPYDIEYRTVHPQTGDYKWIRALGRTFYNNKKKPIHFDGITIDITRQKTLERQKDEFLGIASHELKTPVTSIKVYGQTLESIFKRRGDMNAASLLNKMDNQIDKLNNLISDLLDVTKIQSGKMIFQSSTFDYQSLVDEVIEEVQRTSSQHEIINKPNGKVMIYGDRDRISQVLTNLITNAIKYSPNAKKVIVHTSAYKNSVQTDVKDYGVGIPKSKQQKVFEQFFRVSGPNHNTFPGLGLGLYISSEIIKREGGKIWVESVLGKGSTFSFSLPLTTKEKKKRSN